MILRTLILYSLMTALATSAAVWDFGAPRMMGGRTLLYHAIALQFWSFALIAWYILYNDQKRKNFVFFDAHLPP